jgi:hypothetical protein
MTIHNLGAESRIGVERNRATIEARERKRFAYLMLGYARDETKLQRFRDYTYHYNATQEEAIALAEAGIQDAEQFWHLAFHATLTDYYAAVEANRQLDRCIFLHGANCSPSF